MPEEIVATPPAAGTPPASGVNEPWAKQWIQPDFTLDHKALDRLPDHLKGLRPTLERQKNFEGVLQALDHNVSLAGKKALAPLQDNASPEARAERKALLDTINGVPKEAKEYGISKDKVAKDLPDMAWNQGLADSVAAWAHKYSVSPGAARELVGLQTELVKSQLASQSQEEAKFWGGEQAKFDASIQARNIAADRATDLVTKGAIALGLNLEDPQTQIFMKGANARMMALQHALAIGEDSALTGDEQAGNGSRDYAAMAVSARTDVADPLNGPYWNKGNKYSRGDHEAAVTKVNEYLRLASEQGKKRR